HALVRLRTAAPPARGGREVGLRVGAHAHAERGSERALVDPTRVEALLAGAAIELERRPPERVVCPAHHAGHRAAEVFELVRALVRSALQHDAVHPFPDVAEQVVATEGPAAAALERADVAGRAEAEVRAILEHESVREELAPRTAPRLLVPVAADG